MRTIFDWLNDPTFRKHPAVLIGSNDIHRIHLFIGTYIMACDDAANEAPLLTPGGVSVKLFRSYVAQKENSESTGGIGDILLDGVGGDPARAWERFYAYVDAFTALKITNRQKMGITEKHRRYAKDNCPLSVPDYGVGEINPRHQYIQPAEIRRISLSDGLCWIEDDKHELLYSIAREDDMDRFLRQLYGEICWEPTP